MESSLWCAETAGWTRNPGRYSTAAVWVGMGGRGADEATRGGCVPVLRVVRDPTVYIVGASSAPRCNLHALR